MSGIAIIINGADFSSKNLGKVTLPSLIPSMKITGPDTITESDFGTTLTFTVSGKNIPLASRWDWFSKNEDVLSITNISGTTCTAKVMISETGAAASSVVIDCVAYLSGDTPVGRATKTIIIGSGEANFYQPAVRINASSIDIDNNEINNLGSVDLNGIEWDQNRIPTVTKTGNYFTTDTDTDIYIGRNSAHDNQLLNQIYTPAMTLFNLRDVSSNKTDDYSILFSDLGGQDVVRTHGDTHYTNSDYPEKLDFRIPNIWYNYDFVSVTDSTKKIHINDNEVVAVAVTIDIPNQIAKLYVNGSLVGQCTLTDVPKDQQWQFKSNVYANAWTIYGGKKQYESIIYNKALTDQQIGLVTQKMSNIYEEFDPSNSTGYKLI